jgi:hypothetical protein
MRDRRDDSAAEALSLEEWRQAQGEACVRPVVLQAVELSTAPNKSCVTAQSPRGVAAEQTAVAFETLSHDRELPRSVQDPQCALQMQRAFLCARRLDPLHPPALHGGSDVSPRPWPPIPTHVSTPTSTRTELWQPGPEWLRSANRGRPLDSDKPKLRLALTECVLSTS